MIALEYGCDLNGNLIHISNARKGLKCGLYCPACKKQLIAKKGDLMQHHFAHYKAAECKYAFETSIHLLAKEIIAEDGEIFTPELALLPDHWNMYNYILLKSQYFRIGNIIVEPHLGNIRPDLIVYIDSHPLLIEVCVTHKVDADKLKKIKEHNLSAIEINLSDVGHGMSKEILKEKIKEESRIKWLYNKKRNYYYEKLCSYSITIGDRLNAKIPGFPNIVRRYCPITGRKASFLMNCHGCNYCVASINDPHEEFIWCSQPHKIKNMTDLKNAIKRGLRAIDK